MNHFAILGAVLFAYMSLWFLASVAMRRNDVADVAWGLGFVLMAWISFLISDAPGTRGILAGVLVSMWGLRLAWHIHTRNRGKQEDYRYREWRAAWGSWFYLRSYAQIYLLQGILLFIIALPILVINASPQAPLGPLDLIGTAIWIIGFLFEAIGDAQLSSFMQNPANRGALMQSGLWRYTRHPNYFGEATQWWGLWIIALSAPYGSVAIIGPIAITILITKVSGIPLLEKKMEANPAFADYKKRVSAFVPFL